MTTVTSTETAKTKKVDFLNIASRFGALIFFIVLCVIFAILEPAFLKPTNIFNVLRQAGGNTMPRTAGASPRRQLLFPLDADANRGWQSTSRTIE